MYRHKINRVFIMFAELSWDAIIYVHLWGKEVSAHARGYKQPLPIIGGATSSLPRATNINFCSSLCAVFKSKCN